MFDGEVGVFHAKSTGSLHRWTDKLLEISPPNKTSRELVYVQVGRKMALVARLTLRRKSISGEIFCKSSQSVVIPYSDTGQKRDCVEDAECRDRPREEPNLLSDPDHTG